MAVFSAVHRATASLYMDNTRCLYPTGFLFPSRHTRFFSHPLGSQPSYETRKAEARHQNVDVPKDVAQQMGVQIQIMCHTFNRDRNRGQRLQQNRR